MVARTVLEASWTTRPSHRSSQAKKRYPMNGGNEEVADHDRVAQCLHGERGRNFVEDLDREQRKCEPRVLRKEKARGRDADCQIDREQDPSCGTFGTECAIDPGSSDQKRKTHRNEHHEVQHEGKGDHGFANRSALYEPLELIRLNLRLSNKAELRTSALRGR